METVLPYYTRWMERFQDWHTLAKADESDVLKAWEGLGYYKRAKALHALAKTVVYDLKGELPSSVEELVQLPGIGPYTAGAIASVAFGKQAALVDGNVERGFARLLNLKWDMSKGESKRAMWKIAESMLPQESCGDYNQALMELGALVCIPRKPMCALCPVRRLCQAQEPERLPVKTRVRSLHEEEQLSWIWDSKQKQFWLELPKNPTRWPGCYRLPAAAINRHRKKQTTLFKERYTITRHQVSAYVIKDGAQPPSGRRGKWFKPHELEILFLPAPHRRMIEKALRLTTSLFPLSSA